MVGLEIPDLLALTVDARGVALLRLQRDAALNAFSHALVDALEDALTVLETRAASGPATAESKAVAAEPGLAAIGDAPACRAVIIAGSGRAFAVGAALDELRAAAPRTRVAYNRRLAAAFDRIEALSVPTIAAIDGYALGGGFELALACTLRVVAEDARLGLPEARLGLIPGAGGSWRLPRLIGRGRAALLTLTGDQIDGRRAGELGVAELVVPPAGAEAAALDLAGRIAANGPAAVAALLDLLPRESPVAAGRAIEALLASTDAEQRIAAFLDRRGS